MTNAVMPSALASPNPNLLCVVVVVYQCIISVVECFSLMYNHV